MSNVSVSLLGGFAAAVDGEPVPETAWRLRKARELVKLLALAPGHRLHREQVMDVLWRDREPAAAANNLHQAVYVARRALDAGAIEVRDEMLQLTADVDVDRLALAAVEARASGHLSRISRGALALLRRVAAGESLRRLGGWATGGARGAGRCELEAELAALGSRLPDRLPLPSDASSFIGRDHELVELKALLRGTRLLTLAGTGGVGKTRLALELARASRGVATGWCGARRAGAAHRRPARAGCGCGGARRARAARAEPHRRGRRVCRAALAAACPRQLRASARSDGRAGRHVAASASRADDPRDEPRTAACVRARSCSGFRRWTSLIPSTQSSPRELLALRGRAAVRRSGGCRGAGVRARRGERG